MLKKKKRMQRGKEKNYPSVLKNEMTKNIKNKENENITKCLKFNKYDNNITNINI